MIARNQLESRYEYLLKQRLDCLEYIKRASSSEYDLYIEKLNEVSAIIKLFEDNLNKLGR